MAVVHKGGNRRLGSSGNWPRSRHFRPLELLSQVATEMEAKALSAFRQPTSHLTSNLVMRYSLAYSNRLLEVILDT